MATAFREFPLLNIPSLVRVILSAARQHTVTTIADCLALLEASLEQAHEAPPFPRTEIAARLSATVAVLAEAKLLTMAPDGAFTITPRGEAALVEHPQGFDVSDLMAYPEFARHLRGSDVQRPPMDPRIAGFDQGFDADWHGTLPLDNPYAPDSADHLAWENGWSAAMDIDSRVRAEATSFR